MKLIIFPALCALFALSCRGVPVSPEESAEDRRQHFVNYSSSYADEVVPPSDSYNFRNYPEIGKAFNSAQAFFDSTMGCNDPITIYVSLGEGRNKWNRCAGESLDIIACAEKGRRRIIIAGRDTSNLERDWKWWRMVIIHETFHDLGMVGHWIPPRGTLMDSRPRSIDVHPELWEIMRQEGWCLNGSH